MSYRQDIVAEISLEALRYNLHQFQQYIEPSDVIAVVKADAYGHGAVPVARICAEEGIPMMAVATIEEAVELRDAGIHVQIILLGKVWEHYLDALWQYDIQPVVGSQEDLDLISKASSERRLSLQVHLEIDTGMGRTGILPEESLKTAQSIVEHPYLRLFGVMSHFATSEEVNSGLAARQREHFHSLQQSIAGLTAESDRPMFHLANSGGTLYLSNVNYDRVRLGLSLYGITPTTEQESPLDLKPLMQLKSKVGYVRKLPTGWPVGYGATYRTAESSSLCFCAGGYEDGIPRRYGNTGEVLLYGKRAPIVGNVSMDSFVIDVHDLPAEVGDEIVIIGTQGEQTITVWEMADKLDLIPYEVTCGISDRVPRIYIDNSDSATSHSELVEE